MRQKHDPLNTMTIATKKRLWYWNKRLDWTMMLNFLLAFAGKRGPDRPDNWRPKLVNRGWFSISNSTWDSSVQWGLRELKQSSACNLVKLSYQNFVQGQAPRLRRKWWAVNKIECYKQKRTARETQKRIAEEDNRGKKSEKLNHYILAHWSHEWQMRVLCEIIRDFLKMLHFKQPGNLISHKKISNMNVLRS